jgi:hypothetical protein
VIARTGPPGKVRPPGAGSGGRGDKRQRAAGGTSVSTLQRPADETFSDAQAAAAWRAYWTDEAIRARVLDEIALSDLIARWRIREAGHDFRNAIEDWPRVLDVQMARAKGYRPPERTPDPWPPESLDRDAWRDDEHPYSTNVPVSFRFHPVFAPRAVAA